MTNSSLFNPTDLCGVTLKNRIAMAPMTRSRADSAAVPSPHAAEYYAQRASAGVIVSEAIGVSAQSVGYPRTPGIWNAEQRVSWREITDAVHARGGRIIAQLWHVGRIFSPRNNPEGLSPLAPSAVAAKGRIFTLGGLEALPVPRAMTTAEISNTVRDFAAAAGAALASGFDGVEIHGANGYLVEQFLSDHANRRDDAYGGDPSRRLRFLADIFDATAAQCGDLSRIGLRLSPFGDFNDIRHNDPGAVFKAAAGLLDAREGAYLHLIEPEVSGDGARREEHAG
ncbi:MAG: alkene reductase, partial [Hyphomicrobiaceae bacterium]|nr:alkene reductase [Hyphomicrobiaceae bacterium]